MSDRAIFRLRDIKDSITTIRDILAGQSFEAVYGDLLRKAAFERYLEILSDASRSVPDEWKSRFGPDLPWRQIADLGNTLRHAYHRTDARLLWAVYENDLGPLEAAVDAMLAAHGRRPEQSS